MRGSFRIVLSRCVALAVLMALAALSAAAPARALDFPTPPPLAVTATDPLEQAGEIADGLARRGDKDNYARLVALFSLAGYTIVENGAIVVPPAAGRDQGLRITTFELSVAFDAHESGEGMSLAEMASGIVSVSPGEMPAAELVRALKDGILDGYSGRHEGMRFWGAVLIALGEASGAPWTLADLRSDADLRLGEVQKVLLFTRVAADIGMANGVVGATYRYPLEDRARAGGKPDCVATGAAGVIMDGAAAAGTTGFSKLMDAMEKYKFIAKAPNAAAVGVANIGLAYLKLALYKAFFEVRFGFTEGSPPLVRTHSARDKGEAKIISATARIRDVENIQWLNCARIAINALGIDFSVPNPGPLGNVPVAWDLFKGGQTITGGSIRDRGIVELYGFPLKPATDESGNALIGVVGLNQRFDIPASAPPVMKEAAIRAGFVIKPADLGQDMVDAISLGATAWENPFFAAIGSVPEMLYRTSMFFNGEWTFPVKDWDLELVGTITISLSFKYHDSKSEQISPEESVVRDWSASGSYERIIEVEKVSGGGTADDGSPMFGLGASWASIGKATIVNSEVHEGFDLCGDEKMTRDGIAGRFWNQRIEEFKVTRSEANTSPEYYTMTLVAGVNG